MLQVLVGYTKDLAVDIRWLVIEGASEFSGSPSACTTIFMAIPATVVLLARQRSTMSWRWCTERGQRG
jgi:hypothetical protein